MRKAGPALIAGNAIIIKPHELTPFATFHLAKLALEAGVPTGIFSVVYGPGPSVGRQLVTGCDGKHDVGLVTLTGSTRAGHAIAAAVAPFATVTSLEMGGKAPFIVLEDADLVAAVDACVGSRMFNCGQVCTCPERVLLHVDIADEFTGASNSFFLFRCMTEYLSNIILLYLILMSQRCCSQRSQRLLSVTPPTRRRWLARRFP